MGAYRVKDNDFKGNETVEETVEPIVLKVEIEIDPTTYDGDLADMEDDIFSFKNHCEGLGNVKKFDRE